MKYTDFIELLIHLNELYCVKSSILSFVYKVEDVTVLSFNAVFEALSFQIFKTFVNLIFKCSVNLIYFLHKFVFFRYSFVESRSQFSYFFKRTKLMALRADMTFTIGATKRIRTVGIEADLGDEVAS